MTANVDNVPLPESVFRSVQIVLPTIEYKSVEQIGFGMNRRVYRVSDGQTYWAISIAKSCVYSEINSFRQEVKLLNYLQDIIVSGITPQDAQLVESQDGHFAMIYRFIEGRNLSSVTIPESKLNILAIQIANFFYQLHTISLDSLDSIDIQTINLLDDHYIPMLKIAKDDIDGYSYTYLKNLQEKFRYYDNNFSQSPVLVHGDISGEHLLVDSEYNLCGVIDFGDIMISDFAIDFAGILNDMPKEFLDKIMINYNNSFDTYFFKRVEALINMAPLFDIAYESTVHDSRKKAEAIQKLKQLAIANA
jgi:aminoglycoside phosphotransferase (APT) family kinase protein